jgi:hypothetical protein
MGIIIGRVENGQKLRCFQVSIDCLDTLLIAGKKYYADVT